MLSSNDVAAMFAAQGQSFAHQNYYAQTVGISNPAMSLGARAGPLFGGMQPVGPSFPGVRAPPSVFSFNNNGLTGPGYGSGNSIANTAMSGFGALATAGGIGVGMMVPGLDPISGFMGGMRAAGGFGVRGVMGGMAGAALPMAGAMLAAHTVGSFIGGAQQQSMVNTQLGGFNFHNPMSRTGQGFTRQDASEIGSNIRQLAHVPEMLSSVEELTRLLPQMRRMGVMSGVKDSSEFNRRFKETVNTLRDMSKMMGNTMEEAAQFFEHNRSIGMSSKTAQLRNTLNSQFTSGMTGMTQGQTMQMEQGGAQIARQFGARGVYGAAGVQRMSQNIQGALEGGFLDADTLADVTGGMQGPEAVGAAAQRMYGLMTNLSQTSPGQLIIAGAMKRDKNGKVMLDEDVIKQLNRGEISVNDLKARAGSLSDADKVSFRVHARNLGSQFAGQVDLPKFMQGLLAGKPPEAAALMLQQYTGGQASEADISTLTAMGKGNAGVDMESFKAIRSREMNIREQTDPEMLMKKIKTRVTASLFGGISQAGADIHTSIGRAWESFVDDAVGRYVVTLSKDGAKALRQAVAGGPGSAALRQMFSMASGIKSGTDVLQGSWGEGGVMTMLRRMSEAGTSGLTEYGMQGAMSALTGKSRDQTAEWARTADLGKSVKDGGFVTPEGIAAAGNLAAARRGNRDYAGAKPDVRLGMDRTSVNRSLAKALYKVTKSGALPQEILAELNNGDKKRIEQRLGMSLEEAMGKVVADPELAATEGGKNAAAWMTSPNKGMDPAVAIISTIPREKGAMGASFLGAAGAGGQSYMAAAAVKKQMDSAISGLAGTRLSGPSQAIIRDSSEVRGVANQILNGTTGNGEKAKKIVADFWEDPAIVAAKLSALGSEFALSPEDASKLIDIMKDKGAFDTAGEGISGMATAISDSNRHVIMTRMRDAGLAIKDSASKATGDAGSIASGLADAMSKVGSNFGPESTEALGGAFATAVAAYKKAGKSGRAALQQALGSAGGAVASAADLSRSLDRSTDEFVTTEQLGNMGLSGEEIAGAAGAWGEKAGGLVLDAEMKKRLIGSRAVGGLMGSVGIGAGAVDTGREMVEILKKIGLNADKQTATMLLLANKTAAGRALELTDEQLAAAKSTATAK